MTLRVRRLPPEMATAFKSLRAVGQGAPTPEEKCQIVASLRAQSPETSQRLDRMFVDEAQQLRTGLMEAHANLHELKELLEKVTAPPWHVGVFLHPLDGWGSPGHRMLVHHAGVRRVVNLADGLDPASFGLGELVFLSQDLTCVVGKSPDRLPHVGETARFSRHTDDGRMVLRYRDEELVLDVAAPLRNTELAAGDSIRLDRAAWIAYEKLPRAEARRYLLDEVPTVRSEMVGGQQRNLQTMLGALTTTLVEPEKARRYGLGGRRSILMVGPPGCGKTLMARVAAAEIARQSGRKCRFGVVKPAEFEDPYVGVTEQNIRNCFHALREAASDGMAVLFMDEIECCGRIRGSAVGHHSDKFLAALLAELDGFSDRDGVAVVCATNRKDLVDPALLERISDIEIQVCRPDMRGAREVFGIHLSTALPYCPNGEAAASSRQDLIARAVSRLFAPNADNQLCTLKFRDGKSRPIAARELISGRVIEQICRAARQRAFLRDVRLGDAGLRGEDIDEAVSDAIDRLATTLTPQNARAYLADLPHDIDVVAVEPVVRQLSRAHRYLNVG
jgi:proteasome ATPase